LLCSPFLLPIVQYLEADEEGYARVVEEHAWVEADGKLGILAYEQHVDKDQKHRVVDAYFRVSPTCSSPTPL
jgi:hypothetical protein